MVKKLSTVEESVKEIQDNIGDYGIQDDQDDYIKQYFGWSTCRICEKNNGGEEYYVGDYKWPSGYSHYVKEHNIEVPENFWDFIESKETKIENIKQSLYNKWRV